MCGRWMVDSWLWTSIGMYSSVLQARSGARPPGQRSKDPLRFWTAARFTGARNDALEAKLHSVKSQKNYFPPTPPNFFLSNYKLRQRLQAILVFAFLFYASDHELLIMSNLTSSSCPFLPFFLFQFLFFRLAFFLSFIQCTWGCVRMLCLCRIISVSHQYDGMALLAW